MNMERLAHWARIMCLGLVLWGVGGRAWAVTERDINYTYGNSIDTGGIAPSGDFYAIHSNDLCQVTSWGETSPGSGVWTPLTYSVTPLSSLTATYNIYHIVTGGSVTGETNDIPASVYVEGGTWNSTTTAARIDGNLIVQNGANIRGSVTTFTVTGTTSVTGDVASNGGAVNFHQEPATAAANIIDVWGDQSDKEYSTGTAYTGQITVRDANVDGVVDSSIKAMGGNGKNIVESFDSKYDGTRIEVAGPGSTITMGNRTVLQDSALSATGADTIITINGTTATNDDAIIDSTITTTGTGSKIILDHIDHIGGTIGINSGSKISTSGDGSVVEISGRKGTNGDGYDQYFLDIENTTISAQSSAAGGTSSVLLKDIRLINNTSVTATGTNSSVKINAVAINGGADRNTISATGLNSSVNITATGYTGDLGDGSDDIPANITNMSISATGGNNKVDISAHGIIGSTVKSGDDINTGSGGYINVENIRTITNTDMTAVDYIDINSATGESVTINTTGGGRQFMRAGNLVSIDTIQTLANTDISTTNQSSRVLLTGDGSTNAAHGIQNSLVDANGDDNHIVVKDFAVINDSTFRAGDSATGPKSTIEFTGTGLNSSSYTNLTATAVGVASTVDIDKVGNVTDSLLSTNGANSVVTIKGNVTNTVPTPVQAVYNNVDVTATGVGAKAYVVEGVTMSNTLDTDTGAILAEGGRNNIVLGGNVAFNNYDIKTTDGDGIIDINNNVTMTGTTTQATGGANNKIKVNAGAGSGRVSFAAASSIEAEGPDAQIDVRDNTTFNDSHIRTWNSGAVAKVGDHSNLISVNGQIDNSNTTGVEFTNGSYIEAVGGLYGGNTLVDVKNRVSFNNSGIRTLGGNNQIELTAVLDGNVAFQNNSYIDANGGNTHLNATGKQDNNLWVTFNKSTVDLDKGGNIVTFNDNVFFADASKLIVGDDEKDSGNEIHMANKVIYNNSTVALKGFETIVDLSQNVQFINNSSFDVMGDEATVDLNQNVTFTNSNFKVKGNKADAELMDGVTFTSTVPGTPTNRSRFEVVGNEGKIFTGKNVTFNNATLGLKGNDGGKVEITENGAFSGTSLISVIGSGDTLHIHGNPATPNPLGGLGVQITGKTEIYVQGGKNNVVVDGTTTIKDDAQANILSNDNFVSFDDDALVANTAAVNVSGNHNDVDITGRTSFIDNTSLNVGGTANDLLITGDAKFLNAAAVNLKGTDNIFAIDGKAAFLNNASANVEDDDNTDLTISGNASFDNSATYNLNGDSNILNVFGAAKFGEKSTGVGGVPDGDFAGITAAGENNTIILKGNAHFYNNSMVYATGGENTIVLLDKVEFDKDAQVHALNSKNKVILRSGSPDTGGLETFDTDWKDGSYVFDPKNPVENAKQKIPYTTQTFFSGQGNNLIVAGNTLINEDARIKFYRDSSQDADLAHNGTNDGFDNTVAFIEYSQLTGKMDLQGGLNHLLIADRTRYNGWTQMAGPANTLEIAMDQDLINRRTRYANDATLYNVTGQVVFQDKDKNGNGWALAGSTQNEVLISSGQLTNLHGSVIGSDTIESVVNITGGQTNLLVSGAAGTLYWVDIEDQLMDTPVGAVSKFYAGFRTQGAYEKLETNLYEGNVYNIRAKVGDVAQDNGDFSDYVVGKAGSASKYLRRDEVLNNGKPGEALDNYINFVGNPAVTSGDAPNSPLNQPDVAAKTPARKVYQSYSILNMSETHLDSGAVVNIGGVLSGQYGYKMFNEPTTKSGANDYDRNQERLGLGNQLSTNVLSIYGGSKLMIHEDAARTGKSSSTIASFYSEETRNIINKAYIQAGSEMTIDRTTVHGTVPGTAEIHVLGGTETSGVLYGFGEWNANDRSHQPLRANLVGNLYLDTNALLQPFDADFYSHKDSDGYNDALRNHHTFDTYNQYESQNNQLRGVVFQVSSSDGTAAGTGGNTYFQSSSTIRSRLFADSNGMNPEVVEGDRVKSPTTSYSDYLKSTGSDFSAIVDPDMTAVKSDLVRPYNKVQYQPVFGYHSDLASKLKFNIFDCNTKEQSYYFKVIDGDRTINELVGYNDANHLFNNQILVSDMLGSWNFLKSSDNQDITLRFRLLAEHPMNGGLAANVLDENNLAMARIMDEIRYPFWTPYTDLNLGMDPSFQKRAEFGGGLNPSVPGYNGNMSEWYAANKKSGNHAFDNYTASYIADWERFFLGLQDTLACATSIDDVINQLQPEVYSTLTDTDFDIMSAFIRNRERNSLANRYRPYVNDYCNRCPKQSACPHKSVDPGSLQFWASAFGADGNYNRDNGTSNGIASRSSYGYDTRLWGGAVGLIRDWERSYLGVTIGYGTQKNKWDGLPAETKTDAYIAEVLYGRRIGKGFVEAYADFSYNDQDVRRSIKAGRYEANFDAKFHDLVFAGGVRAGYLADLGCGWTLMPTVAVNVMHARSNTIEETRGSIGAQGAATQLVLDQSSMNRTVVRVPIMAKVSKVFKTGNCVEIVPEAHAGVIANLGNTSSKVKAKFAGNPTDNRWFSAESEGKGDVEAVVGGSVEIGRKDQYYFSGSYDFSASKNSKEHSFSLATGVNF